MDTHGRTKEQQGTADVVRHIVCRCGVNVITTPSRAKSQGWRQFNSGAWECPACQEERQRA